MADWGVITESNPGAVLSHNEIPATDPQEAWLERKKKPKMCTLQTEILDTALGPECGNLKEIDIGVDDWLSNKPHSLAGRATAVVGASDSDNSIQGELARKISFPEVAREGEGTIIEELRMEIEGNSEKKHLVKHLPRVLVYRDMSRYGTLRVRSMLRTSIRFRVLISRKLVPLTDLKDDTFVKAWLEVVRFHAFLWTIGVEHGDPSLWNVMYNEDLQCGVLGDYDLSISRRRPRVLGTERTGTIPFMAIQLLCREYWDGEIERLYRHELEAFIWILPFVCMRYQDKKPRRGTPVDKWMTSDYNACCKEKNHFWRPDWIGKWADRSQADFKDLWWLAYHLLDWWDRLVSDLARAENDRKLDQARGIASPAEDDSNVASIWPVFVAALKRAAEKFPKQLGFMNKLIDQLDLNTL